ncbi:unnamed protein product [Polarella glacialis]|uniref:Uncharacterized protein n=1 Tax=Polarella glacialis TaxID=89957 RepID=A0A813DS21_POLGL|nr:unnamed protein product [Polarella glacialis]
MFSDGALETGQSAHSSEPPNAANPPALHCHPSGSGNTGGHHRHDGGALVFERCNTNSFARRLRRRRCSYNAGIQAGIRVWIGAPGLQLVQDNNMSGAHGYEVGHQKARDEMKEEEKKLDEEGKVDSVAMTTTTTVAQEKKK